jgi:hypothetical protein
MGFKNTKQGREKNSFLQVKPGISIYGCPLKTYSLARRVCMHHNSPNNRISFSAPFFIDN